jgi:MOSC domain-containing protein YiiM
MDMIEQLTGRFPRTGKVEWIGIRPARVQPVVSVARVAVWRGGLEGDHREKEGLRAVTLIQYEHLAAIAALAGLASVDPAMLRRNIAVSGINLLALKDRLFRVGTTILKGTEICAPCSRMEAALGPGGYNAMRGHGGLCAAVIEEGEIAVASDVAALMPEMVQRSLT